MPPTRTKRPSDQTVTSSSSSHPSSYALDDDDDAPPFLNTTFTTHRVSPLYVGPHPLTQDRLHVLSQRLRDLVVGDVVRGVEVGLDRGADDAAMRRAGALETVAMGWVRLEALVGSYVGDQEEEEQQQQQKQRQQQQQHADGAGDVSGVSLDSGGGSAGSPGKRRALQIVLQYENAECAALLLPALRPTAAPTRVDAPSEEQEQQEAGPRTDASAGASTSLFGFAASRPGGGDQDDADFLRLPLVLLRMPAPLRTVLLDFISRTFDCRVSSLSLGTRTLVGALERWMGDSGVPTRGPLAKDVVLSLGFYGPTVTRQQRLPQKEAAPTAEADGGDEAGRARAQDSALGVKSIDAIIPNQDLRRFVRVGSGSATSRNAAKAGAGHARDVFGHAKRRRLGGDKDEESWTWRRWDVDGSTKQPGTDQADVRPQPFTEALAQYVRENLALDMFHPAVRVTKIACGGFVLSEGRVKIFGVVPRGDEDVGMSATAQRALWAVLEALLERAQLKLPENTLSGKTVDQSVGRAARAEASVVSSEI